MTQPRQASLAILALLTLGGCAYRLPPLNLPRQEHLKVVAAKPNAYVLRLRIRESSDYHIPADGRVTLEIPAYRAECRVYLFDKIMVRHGADPFTAKIVDLFAAGKLARQLSLKDVSALPVDEQGYHLLNVPHR